MRRFRFTNTRLLMVLACLGLAGGAARAEPAARMYRPVPITKSTSPAVALNRVTLNPQPLPPRIPWPPLGTRLSDSRPPVFSGLGSLSPGRTSGSLAQPMRRAGLRP